jgi:Tfp pilus assembly protein PilV
MPVGMLRLRSLRSEGGFTLIEVMVAITILIVGVLGTVALIDGANATTSTTKGREGATNLARELIENSRAVDYDKVTQTALAYELQQRPGLADINPANGWQVQRRRITYTIEVTACTFDDGTDDTGTHDATFCSNSATSPAGDSNPDDYRKVVFTVSWKDGPNTRHVGQTGIVNNPAGGLGPSISSLVCNSCQPGDVVGPGASSAAFTVQSAAADTVNWSADDGRPASLATDGPTTWHFTWQLGNVGSFSCATTPNWTLDGTYLVSAQAFDVRSVPGDLKTRPVLVDRSAPAPPCGLDGGRNGGIVDLQWLANPERDIAGYRVFRVKVGAETTDAEVCPLTSDTSCFDPSPPSAATYPMLQYYLRAEDGGGRKTVSALKTISQSGNTPPTAPASLTASVIDGKPVLTWTAASDPDGSIRLYRIYRDGVTYADRYDLVDGQQLSYTDKRGDAGAHRYWVTAVDNRFAESPPVGPVTP